MLGELRWHVLVCSVNLQVDRAALHFGRNSQRHVQFLFPKRMFSECIHTFHAKLSVMPKRIAPKNAGHKPKITWSVCITLKRHVGYALRLRSFGHGLIVDRTRESHQGGVCQEGTAPSCGKPKDCRRSCGWCYNGCRSHSTKWRTTQRTVDV